MLGNSDNAWGWPAKLLHWIGAILILLLLGQLSLWYQHRPLLVGEEAVVALALGGDAGGPMPAVTLEPNPAA